ncbi:MAG: FecR domain-containing protein [Steroidobacteraceae bacterium]|nr:FecR domain-containing protein [Steroidobacteraceae bacterium]MDW8258132.1 FecR domain-containing protein [Gammaproteobacteria bacterium]
MTEELDDERLTALLRRAARTQPPPALRESARQAVWQAWRRSLAEHANAIALTPSEPRSGARRRYALAAAVVLAIAAGAMIGYETWRDRIAQRPVAQVLRGTVEVDTERRAAPLPLRVAQSIVTGKPAGAFVEVTPQLTVRLAPDTHVRFRDHRRLELRRGRVFVAADAGAPNDFVILTPAGDVRHLGTAYAVHVTARRTVIAVRSGRAQLAAGGRTATAVGAGQVLEIGDGSAMRLSRATNSENYFGWLGSMPADFVIDGRSLREFLEWYAAESHRELEYGDAATRAAAASTRLSGSIDGLTADEALEALTAAAEFDARIADGRVIVTLKIRS